MMYALTAQGSKVEASPGGSALCPCCSSPVIAKCGAINIWHWAHRKGSDCPDWHEPETAWHREWKSCAPPQCREVTVGKHRADVLVNGTAIEFQHSSISVDDIWNREDNYQKLIWVVDGVMAYERHEENPNDTVGLQIEELGAGRAKMVWFHGKKWVRECGHRVFIDLGGRGVDGLLFEIEKWWNTNTLIADGHMVRHNKFISNFMTPPAPAVFVSRPSPYNDFPAFKGSA